MFSLNRGNFVLPTGVSVSGNPLYVSSSLVQSNNQIIVKAVNVNNSAMTTTFNFERRRFDCLHRHGHPTVRQPERHQLVHHADGDFPGDQLNRQRRNEFHGEPRRPIR